MNHLEKLGKEAFEAYCHKQANTTYNWYHLPKARRVAWMQEILEAYLFVIHEMQQMIKFEPGINRANTSYALGRTEGINAEKTRYYNELLNMSIRLKEDLEDYKNKE